MLLTKNNIKEFTKAVQELIKNSRAKAKPILDDILPVIFGQEPIAVKYNREIVEKKRRDMEAIKKLRPGMKDIIEFAQQNKLIYNNLNPYHFRIKNPNTGQFVDWWDGKKKTMRSINGAFGVQGKNKVFLLQEIVKLV